MSEPLPPEDRRWLESAVRFARPFHGTTGGKPLAAALVVNDLEGVVVGRAVSTGVNSAEAAALEEAGSAAYGRTLYVTLEPQHELIAAAGIARVVIGAEHPDRARRGRGVAALREAGIEVVLAEHAPSADLFEAQARRMATGRPLVTLRLAMSADGMIARRDGKPVAIMGDRAARWASMRRALSDGVMIGAQTAALDDPRLDVGLDGFEDRPYARVLVAGARTLPERLNLTGWISGHPTFVVATEGRDFEVPSFVEILRVPGRRDRPDLRKTLAALAQRNVSALLVEGGATLTEAMVASELVDRFLLIECAARVGRDGLPATPLGGLEGRLRAAGLVETSRESLGEDLLRVFEPEFQAPRQNRAEY